MDESTDGGAGTETQTATATRGATEERRQRYSRTESVSSSDGYDSEYFAVQCSDGKGCFVFITSCYLIEDIQDR